MNISRKQFRSIETIIDNMNERLSRDAQSDNGEDVRMTRDQYRKRLERLVSKWSRRPTTRKTKR